MCTISGHFSHGEPSAATDIYDMLKKMAHRGPDMHGVYLDGVVARHKTLDEFKPLLRRKCRIALGYSHLGIVGAEDLPQPYTSCDGKLTLIKSGEIYNHKALKSLLLYKHRFETASDSEIVVHLLEESYRGDLLEAVKRVIGIMDGMYAFAVTDGESVVLARDPIGKKPLYYLESGPITYFASQKKALWNGAEDPVRLRPGEIVCIDRTGRSNHPGVAVQIPQIDIVDFRDAVERYKIVLVKAMQKRLAGLRQDRLGVIFSGGIDSVLIAKLLQREGKNITCYCTGTVDSGDILAAQTVAEELGLELKTAIIDADLIQGILSEVIRNVEEGGLLQVEVAIPMYLAAKLAAEDGIRVMYTGQAADELFAGYPWYSDVLKEWGYLRLHEQLWEDLNYLYDDTLEREDKLTMSHSIELRAPYLDRDVIRTSMRISPRLKIQGCADELRKRVHRQAAVELGVPPFLAFRVKDPAQSGSGIHQIIENIARTQNVALDTELVTENIKIDKGSLYRYGRGVYGEAVARNYIQRLHREIQNSYRPTILK
ncbi:MAG: asparagine synthetase B [Pseudomonadota bacterium]|nr:asparagine synthetase B [Pseudomonadota bacterium]